MPLDITKALKITMVRNIDNWHLQLESAVCSFKSKITKVSNTKVHNIAEEEKEVDGIETKLLIKINWWTV